MHCTPHSKYILIKFCKPANRMYIYSFLDCFIDNTMSMGVANMPCSLNTSNFNPPNIPPISSGSAVSVWTVFSPAALGETGPSWAKKTQGEAWACSEHHPLTIKGGPANIATSDWWIPHC